MIPEHSLTTLVWPLMYPLPDPVLYLCDIARYWAREIQPPMPGHEILDRLVAAFWRGDLFATFNRTKADVAQRSTALAALALMNDHPGLLFVQEGVQPPPQLEAMPDGMALADPRHRVIWPPKFDRKFDRECDGVAEAAYQQLSLVSLADYDPDIRPTLELLEVTRSDFAAFCERHAYPLPRFWFRTLRGNEAIENGECVPPPSDDSSAVDGMPPESDFEDWHRHFAMENPRASDNEVWSAAKAKFPDKKIPRSQVRKLRAPPDGALRHRGRKEGKKESDFRR